MWRENIYKDGRNELACSGSVKRMQKLVFPLQVNVVLIIIIIIDPLKDLKEVTLH